MPLPRPDSYENLLAGVTQLVDALERQMAQLAAPQAGRKIAFGKGTLTWGGGSPFATSPNVAHGLGVIPAVLVPNALGASATIELFSPITLGSAVLDATNFSAQAVTVDGSSPAAGHILTICWLAIG